VPTSILKSIKGNVVRLTRLDSCGNPVIGSCSSLVSECFVSVTISGEYEAGDEFVQKNAWGELCISDKNPDILKRVNVSIQFAEINPDALDIITDAAKVMVTGNAVGATWGTAPNEGPFALEVWTKAAGAACSASTPVWGYFLVPYIRNGKLDGDMVIENGVLTVGVMGEGFPALNDGTSASFWGVGPYTSNPFQVTFPIGEVFGIVTTTTQPPADTAGCVAVS
jgi:hypothetical protein